jgi:hypothetical protein
MPRLRHLRKELTYEELFSDGPQRGDEADASESQQSGTQESPPLGGWWSNENVIASLPDAKLRETYHRYRALADACDQELKRRASQGIKVRGEARFDVKSGGRVYRSVETYHRVRGQTPARNKQRQSALTPEQLLQALQMLMKLKEAKHAASHASVHTDPTKGL